MEMGYASSNASSQRNSLEGEDKERLLFSPIVWRSGKSGKWFYSRTHIIGLYAINITLLLIVFFLTTRLAHRPFLDPTLGVYSPANEAVEWIKEQKFTAALFSKTPYMGFPTNATDQLWLDLYDYTAISKISKEEAQMLPHPTLAIPGTDEYLVQLDVFHELHCIDDLRKLLYPERFSGLEELKDENGVINRERHAFLHWDHCIDALRQTVMCHADISPIPWRVNIPANKAWARDHDAGDWTYILSDEQAEEVIRSAGFDQGPGEDIEHLYKLFPGDSFFKYWREHPIEAEEARKAMSMSDSGVEEGELV